MSADLTDQTAETVGRFSAEETALLREHFDETYYLALNPEVADIGVDPLAHYIAKGEAEGRKPSPEFDPAHYRAHYADMANAGFNLFWHWVTAGRAEGRQGAPMIAAELDPRRDEAQLVERLRAHMSEAAYYEMYPDVKAAGFDAVVHYVRHGEEEGRKPTPEFDPFAYRASDPSLEGATFNLFWYKLALELGAARHIVSEEEAARVAEARRQRDHARAIQERPLVEPHFDEAYYLAEHPEVAEASVDPVIHYLMEGDRRGLRPTPAFNPDYYRRANPDVARINRSAFWHYHAHGKAELRSPDAYYELKGEPTFTVTAIVPNYNHARFLDERLRSIAEQTYPNIEILILDDASTDDSRAVIERLAAACPRPVRVVLNDANSGNAFAQWQKGLELATGDLVWICESDDTCAPDFVERLARHFREESVTMAFGRIEFITADGAPMEGMDGFRQSAEAIDWTQPLKRPAAEWFAKAFGVRNVIANVGGAMFRRQALPAAVWERAKGFRIAGDWYLYSQIAGGGQIVYDPEAVAHFRQHGANTSASNFGEAFYYREYGRIMLALCEMWDIPAATRQSFLDKVRAEFEHFGMPAKGFTFEDVLPVAEIMAARRTAKHIQIGFLGFHSGGGEVFALRLAELLRERGFVVSMLAQNLTDVVEDMRRFVSPGMPVYHVADVATMGRDAYLTRCGIDLVHTHVNAVDSTFFSQDKALQARPYVITLHGSHDFLDLDVPQIAGYVETMANNVSAFVYTAAKNLHLFERGTMPTHRLFKINNAMPRDTEPFEMSRGEMGIADDAVVFTLVARGIERKGWRVAVGAFLAVKRAHPERAMHLLLVGDGEKTAEAAALADGSPDITFLGYQSRINGIYALSDVAILPTRYPGESNPLCLIQAAQEGLPIIAADIGEIAGMLALPDRLGGIVVPVERDTARFTAAFAHQMGRMLGAAERAHFARLSRRVEEKFQTGAMVESYIDVYAFAARAHAAEARRRAAP